jgi:hypothetical protein
MHLTWPEYKARQREASREYWVRMMRLYGGDVRAMARGCLINRTHLYRMFARLDVPIVRKTRHGNKGNAQWQAMAGREQRAG